MIIQIVMSALLFNKFTSLTASTLTKVNRLPFLWSKPPGHTLVNLIWLFSCRFQVHFLHSLYYIYGVSFKRHYYSPL